MNAVQVLAGDIGGTKTWLALVRFGTGAQSGEIIFERRYASVAYADFTSLLESFLQDAGAPVVRSACFAVAGPINKEMSGQTVKVTNLPWILNSTALAARLAVAELVLINDFQAVGYGVEALTQADLCVLQRGEPQMHAPRLVVGPGTGLGVSILVWQYDHYEALAAEGGHVDFAPADALQMELLRYMWERYPHVSYERLVSGPGLVHIYEFLCARGAERGVDALRGGDPAAAIGVLALQGDSLAARAVELFVEICGAYAGNLALVCLPYGGVYIAGGIAPKLLDKFTDGVFLRAFCNKGRMAKLLADMPVQLIRNPKAGLWGAALVAHRLSECDGATLPTLAQNPA